MDLALEVVAEGVENAGMARQLLLAGLRLRPGLRLRARLLSAQEAEVYLNESYVDGRSRR